VTSATKPPHSFPVSEAEHERMLDELQKETYQYFIHEVNPANGLTADKTKDGWPASTAATGFALSTYPVVVEDGLFSREEAAERTLATLRFFWNSPQSKAPDATGYKGFYYHFLDMETGRRAWQSELSTIDTAFLLAGVLLAGQYFNQDNEAEAEIRDLADKLYRRCDWRWALNGNVLVNHGWMPERGFLPFSWNGYDEALLLYILGLGSPTSPLPEESYVATTKDYYWKEMYDYEYIYAGSLFIHQYPQVWLDFRGIQDAYTRDRDLDYFENSRRATYIQREYAIRNPKEYKGYNETHWGITACDGPGPATHRVDGILRVFFDYVARGVPFGPDDGTIAPWAVVSSLPFAPEIVLPTIQAFNELDLKSGTINSYGYKATVNRTFPFQNTPHGWVSPYHFGINQGPIVGMIENYQTGMLWRLMSQCAYVVKGLRRAGFRGGWLEDAD